MEQYADIPVPPGRGRSGRGGGGLRGFLRGQSYLLSSEQIIDNPVPRIARTTTRNWNVKKTETNHVLGGNLEGDGFHHADMECQRSA